MYFSSKARYSISKTNKKCDFTNQINALAIIVCCICVFPRNAVAHTKSLAYAIHACRARIARKNKKIHTYNNTIIQ